MLLKARDAAQREITKVEKLTLSLHKYGDGEFI